MTHLATILWPASKVWSPTNQSGLWGSDKTRGQGSFGPLTGALDLQGSLQPAELNKLDQAFATNGLIHSKNQILVQAIFTT